MPFGWQNTDLFAPIYTIVFLPLSSALYTVPHMHVVQSSVTSHDAAMPPMTDYDLLL